MSRDQRPGDGRAGPAGDRDIVVRDLRKVIDTLREDLDNLRAEREDLKLRIESMYAANDRAESCPAALRANWTTRDVATYTGKKESTIRAYHARGQMPKPDGQLGRTPWWKPDTIRAWR